MPNLFSGSTPGFFLLFIVSTLSVSAQSSNQDYQALFRRCAAQELSALEQAPQFHFLERVEYGWGSETRDVIETSQGRADRIVEFHDKAVYPDQQRKQYNRLKTLFSDSEAAGKEIDGQNQERQRRIRMARALPDAVSVEFSGKESNGQLRFSFVPNPHFSAKDKETRIYEGMQGSLWIDPVQERIVRVQGELFRDVSFGWGVFGRLYKGGKYELAQTEIEPGVWRITTLDLDFHGRILFKAIRVLSKESSKNFVRTAPGMTYHQALEHLLAGYPNG